MSIFYDYAIIGGDNRLLYLADLLSEKGLSVCYFGLNPNCLPLHNIPNFKSSKIVQAQSLQEAINNSTYLIGPIPFSKDNHTLNANHAFEIKIDDVIFFMKPEQILFAGGFSNAVKSKATEYNRCIVDMMEWEEVAILNAVATAEGTICEAIERSNRNLQGSNSLILGFGRCGQILAKKIRALDSILYIGVRKKEALSLALAYGYYGLLLSELEHSIMKFDFIFNTIPAMVLPERLLVKTKEDVTIIDIASNPGGLDYDFVCKQSTNACLCLGLPGKCSPKSSAQILLDPILLYCN